MKSYVRSNFYYKYTKTYINGSKNAYKYKYENYLTEILI